MTIEKKSGKEKNRRKKHNMKKQERKKRGREKNTTNRTQQKKRGKSALYSCVVVCEVVRDRKTQIQIG